MIHIKDRFALLDAMVLPGSVGAEIGVERGDFSDQILRRNPARLYLVDTWESYDAYSHEEWINRSNHAGSLEICRSRFAGDARVQIIRGFSTTVALCGQLNPLDWVYLDANHQYEFTFCDLVAWSLRLAPGGFLMGHDYILRPAENFGVIRAVEEFCRRFGWEMTHKTTDPISSYVLHRRP